MTIAIKPTASGSTIEQNGSTILTVDGSGNITPSNSMYPKVPAFSVTASSAQSISTGTSTKVAFDTETFDTNSNYDTTNYRFTPTVAGYYQINASVNESSNNYEVSLTLRKNGSLFRVLADLGSQVYALAGSAIVYLNGSTDYIEVYYYQGSGSTQSVSHTYSYFDGHLVSV